jgi:hypothetical protein
MNRDLKYFAFVLLLGMALGCSNKHLAQSAQKEEVESLEKQANYYAALAKVKLDSARFLKATQEYDVVTMNRILAEGGAYADSAIILMNKVLLLKSKL